MKNKKQTTDCMLMCVSRILKLSEIIMWGPGPSEGTLHVIIGNPGVPLRLIVGGNLFFCCLQGRISMPWWRMSVAPKEANDIVAAGQIVTPAQ